MRKKEGGGGTDRVLFESVAGVHVSAVLKTLLYRGGGGVVTRHPIYISDDA